MQISVPKLNIFNKLPTTIYAITHATETPINTHGTLLVVGNSEKLVAKLPWNLPYTITATSEDSSIISVDGDTITAVSAGETTVTGKLKVDDAEKDFSINILVVNDIDELL